MTQALVNLPSDRSIDSPHIQQIYVFGDSFSDSGNAYHDTHHALANQPNLPGRFSNGTVWVEHLAAQFQLNLEPSCESSKPGVAVNFAYGGATTGEANLFPAVMPDLPALPGLQQQISQFEQAQHLITPATLGVIWAGAADYAPFVNGIPQQTDSTIPLQNLKAAIAKLLSLGFPCILVLNVPDLSRTPLAPMVAEITSPESVQTAIASHNAKLAEWIQTQPQIQLFDLHQWLNQVLEHPEQFGFQDIQQGASLVEGLNPETCLFWDQVHFTAQAHQHLATAVHQALQIQARSF